ncbi:F420-dependent glucose-6-phosphate dehydrogenase [Streptomyces sp. enrichment culture]|uniref:hypothetical protein n=1 Tax=Streptomyces sp. enrichment culture TaxID=1795815 RepID=UPI003F55B569
MEIGCKPASEALGPEELVRQAVRAEAAGFDFVETGDPFHPWLDARGHPSIVRRYPAAGGSDPGHAEAPMAWAHDEQTAAEAAPETSRRALTGWKVTSELPIPVPFDAATATVRTEDALGKFACGPDPDRYVTAVQKYADAGFDRLVMQNAGPGPDGFIDFCQREPDQPLRRLRPGRASS